MKKLIWMTFLLPNVCGVDKIAEACYGDGWHLQPGCGTQETTYPGLIFLGAKDPLSCPSVLNYNETNSTLTDLCCRINQSNTCGGMLNITTRPVYQTYFTKCVGRQQCSDDVPIERIQSSTFQNCNPQFHENTTVVTMTYECIKAVRNMFNVSIITNHSAIHIKGQDYPNPIQKRGVDCNNPDDVIQCSIETRDCSDVINVESWDLRLEHGQELWFCELNETVKLTSDNNTGVHKNLNAYQSVTNRIIVTFKNNFSRDGGHFWLAFVPDPVSSTLTVKCPVANASCPQYSSCHIFQERTCPPCGTNCIDDKNKVPYDIIIASVVVFFLIVLIVIIIVLWKYGCLKRKIKPNTGNGNNQPQPSGDDLAERDQNDIALTRPINRLPPIAPTTQNESEEIRTRKEKKKRKKKRKTVTEDNSFSDPNEASMTQGTEVSKMTNRKESKKENTSEANPDVVSISGERTEVSERTSRMKGNAEDTFTSCPDPNVTLNSGEERDVAETRKPKKRKRKKTKKNKTIPEDEITDK